MTKYAFVLSEKLLLPVILRPTTRTCHACQNVELPENIQKRRSPASFEKNPDWVIFPSLSARKHVWLNRQQKAAGDILGLSPFNRLEINEGANAGIIACGLSYNYVREALRLTGLKASILKIGAPYPLPAPPVLELFKHAERILVIEEQEPVVEDQVISLAWQHCLESAFRENTIVWRPGKENLM